MPPLSQRDLYLQGIELFNAGRYFEAHEVWEDIWRDASGIEREFWQGLIQCAVALEHYVRSNPRGVISLYRTYNAHLSRVPSQMMGLDVSEFLRAMDRILRPIVDAVPTPQRGQIHFDPATAPLIRLDEVPDDF